MADEPERPQDPRARVAEFLARFGRERNLNLPPLADDGVGMIQRGTAVVTIHVLPPAFVTSAFVDAYTNAPERSSETGSRSSGLNPAEA